MMEMTPSIVFSAMTIGMIAMLFGLCWLASRAGQSSEKIKQAKAEVKNAVKQKEIANEQTEIANNAATDRNDALLNKLSKRSRSNR